MEKIQVKLWINDNWVKFKIEIKTYDNIMTFFQESNILFVSTMNIDFNSIPLELHGFGHSNNLLEYLSNNENNNNLISNFLTYFLNNLLNIKYLNGVNINFYFYNEKWQNIKININKLNNTIISYLTVDSELLTCDNYNITCDQI